MFAVITPALISGGIVDRMRFGPWLVFLVLWLTLVYAPLGYWNWGGGWMYQIGAWDFAGGMVVHESAGFSALGAILVLGPRKLPKGKPKPEPHSLVNVMAGTAILWFGWFGFNGGSALSIGGLATIAFVNTQLAPAAGMMAWLFLDWITNGKPTMNGACAGVVAGLVVITPGAGFMQPQMAMLAGIVGTLWCFSAVEFVKHMTSLDDPCDTFGVHGMAGFMGTVIVGIFSDPEDCLADSSPAWCANPGTVARSPRQFLIQLICGIVAALYSFVVTWIITKIMMSTCFKPLRTYEEQQTTTDWIAHGEKAWALGRAEFDDDEDDLEEDGSYESPRNSTSRSGLSAPSSVRDFYVLPAAEKLYPMENGVPSYATTKVSPRGGRYPAPL